MNDNKELFEVLKRRGFIKQITDEKIFDIIKNNKVTAYIGYDATAYSLHVGSLLTIMLLSWLQKFGHKPIALIGGGTTLIGDPSGKIEMRKMLTYEQIKENEVGIKNNLSNFLKFGDGKDDAIILNNADWLCKFNYIDFLREIGKHFSVNRMLTMESVKLRLEKGLSFLEFNYMILQAYDFMYLNKHHNCTLQMGGDDQWGNIVAGIDLTRRKNQNEVFGITSPLITTASGGKMGKTETGTVWLDPKMTSPYDFYQYWINVDDRDVKRFLNFFTFLPDDEIDRLGNLEGAEIREAKKVLAYEVTKLAHGKEEADNAIKTTETTFGNKAAADEIDEKITTDITADDLKNGMPIIDTLTETKLVSSKSEARRMITQGGVYVNENRIDNIDHKIIMDNMTCQRIIRIRVGKKKHHILRVKGSL